jgi:acetoin utilization protein AcuB
MIVRNWMQPNPVTVDGDTLVSRAKEIITERNLPGLPVVDDGRLRGLVTPAHCLRAAHFVTRTQNPDELDYFVTRLKVKDIMVRNPATVDASDTMEHCLSRGLELGVSQFPVLEDGRVVGMISAAEIFSLTTHFLGAWGSPSGLTLALPRSGPGVLGRIVDVAEIAGAVLLALYPITRSGTRLASGFSEKRLIVRFHAADVGVVAAALEAAGFRVLESVESPRTSRYDA